MAREQSTESLHNGKTILSIRNSHTGTGTSHISAELIDDVEVALDTYLGQKS